MSSRNDSDTTPNSEPCREPNNLFRDARIRLFGTRESLAEAVNAQLPPAYVVAANDIGKIERGIVTEKPGQAIAVCLDQAE